MLILSGIPSWLALAYGFLLFHLQFVGINADWQALNITSGALTPREEACFVMANGKAYLIGGRGQKPTDVYDPVTNSWTQKTGPPIELHHIQCVAYGTKIYIPAAWSGVYPNERTVQRMYIYETTNDTWTSRAGLPKNRLRGAAAVVLIGDDIYVSHGGYGGHGINGTAVGWLDKFNIIYGNWTSLATAPNPRDHTGGGLVKGRICVAGGRENGVADFFNRTVLPTDCYDIATDTWTVEANIPQGRAGSAYGVSCDGKLIVAGGEGYGVAWTNVDAFNGTSWSSFDPLLQARHGTGLAVSCGTNESVYIASGSSAEGAALKLPGSEVWTPGDPTIRINAGGNTFVDISGKKWLSDRFFQGGSTYNVSFDILGTQIDELYQTERRGDFTYLIPISVPGWYGIKIHMAEIVYKEPGVRVFDVLIQDKIFLDDLDLPATVGFQKKQDYLTTVKVTGSFLKIQVVSPNDIKGKISGFQIWKSG